HTRLIFDAGEMLDNVLAVSGSCVDPVGEMRARYSHPFHPLFPSCHVFVILLAQPLHHFVGGLASGECSQHGHRRRMPARSTRIRAACWTDEAAECPGSASRPCAGWTAVAQHERRSDARVLCFTPPATNSPETQRSRRQSRP